MIGQIIGNPLNDIKNQISDQVSQGVGNGFTQISHDLIMFLTFLFEKILAIGAVAVIGYIVLYCILYMFLGEPKSLQKILLGYFLILLVRILNILIVGGWNYGNSINH